MGILRISRITNARAIPKKNYATAARAITINASKKGGREECYAFAQMAVAKVVLKKAGITGEKRKALIELMNQVWGSKKNPELAKSVEKIVRPEAILHLISMLLTFKRIVISSGVKHDFVPNGIAQILDNLFALNSAKQHRFFRKRAAGMPLLAKEEKIWNVIGQLGESRQFNRNVYADCVRTLNYGGADKYDIVVEILKKHGVKIE